MSYFVRDNEKKTLAIMFFLSLVFIYPLMHYGLYFRDDLHRSINGYYGWGVLGRPLADLVIKLASSSGDKLLDIFPYSLIVSAFFIALACLYLRRFLFQNGVTAATFCASLIIFNPYFLQNFAYRFDSLGMSLALLLSLCSYTYTHANIYISTISKIAMGVASLSLYQPCANIYIGLIAVESASFLINRKSTLKIFVKTISLRCVVFIAYYVIYYVTVANIWGSSNKRAQLISFDNKGIDQVLGTFHRINSLIEQFITGPAIYYFLIPLFFALTAIIKALCNDKNSFIFRLLAIATIVFSLYISLPGPTVLLADAPVFPRTLVSFSCVFVVLAILISYLSVNIKFIALIPIVTVLSFSAQMSNALNAQREFEDYVISMVAHDLINIEGIKQIKTVGKVRLNKRAELLANEKPLIYHSVSRASEFLVTYQMVNKGLIGVSEGYGIESQNRNMVLSFKKEGVLPLIRNIEYSIYIKDGIAVVVFDNAI
ncbi:glucosyltransferase domain-containing protein [Pseudocitrobacter faecalis]|uniref:glucosyltransferase domain-containing protein n=1 Tax=Pseudocitrobacter faecalis TaxID=1398493 RepID=UPI00389B04E9